MITLPVKIPNQVSFLEYNVSVFIFRTRKILPIEKKQKNSDGQTDNDKFRVTAHIILKKPDIVVESKQKIDINMSFNRLNMSNFLSTY